MMAERRCPGQDLSKWKPGDIFDVQCPWCRHEIEFWKDEPFRLCPGCQQEVRNPRIDLGCAKWCKSATQCLGREVSDPDLQASIRDRLLAAMKGTFGSDQRRIDHAFRVLEYAEAIQKAEGGDSLVVRAAAILHDIGIKEAERKHGSSAGRFQELEGPPIARHIMRMIELDAPTIEHVCRIVGSHHSAHDIDTIEFRIVWDADWLVNIPEEYPAADKEELAQLIQCTFRTKKGRELAEALFLK